MKTKRSVFLSLILSAALVQGTAIINFTADEGFLEGSLDGQQGWSVPTPADANVVAGGLSYANGPVVHNGGGQKLSLLGGNETRISLGLPTTYEADDSFYFSFLYTHNSGDTFLWFAFAGGADDDNNSIAALSRFPTASLRSRVRDTGQSEQGGSPLPNDQTHLIVGEVSFGGDSAVSTLSLWLNPDSLDKSEVVADIVDPGRNIGVAELNTLWIRKGGGDGEGFIDHIMIGDSWDAVVIPEPSTYAALFGLAAFGLVLLLRRRK